jgi:nucleotide-binding universal stress UspA family protein
MFKHILIPTDGSPVSARAVKAAIAFAKESGARVTAYHCVDPVPRAMYGDGYVPSKQIIAEIERRTRAAAQKHVAAVATAARKAGVEFDTLIEAPRTSYEGIVAAAVKRDCDLIFMGTHGYRGLMRLALGSVAEKVTRFSKVPVLVYR